jgi:uncharacterized protein YkwD
VAEYRPQADVLRSSGVHVRPRRTLASALTVLLVALVIGAVSMVASLALGDTRPHGTGHGVAVADPSDDGTADDGTDPDESGSPEPDAGDATAVSNPPAPSPSVGTAPAKPLPPQPAGVPGMEAQVLTLVNVERAKKAGCKPVTLDTHLATAARAHSVDMARRGYFDHTTPDGVEFATRIKSAGYSWSTAGENIAEGQQDPASVMKAWMNSPGHKANILNCAFKNLGVGLAFDGKHTPFWTQDFASL